MQWAVAVSMASMPAGGFPIRVGSATELSIDPRVSADRHELTVSMHLRDDRGAPLGRRPLTLSVTTSHGRTLGTELRTDERGDASWDVAAGEAERSVVVDVQFAGEERFARSAAHADVDLDAPFVTVELLAPTEAIALGQAPAPLLVRVDTGRAASLAPGRLPVDVAVVAEGRSDVIAAGVTDASGRATLEVLATAFRRPGVYTLRPRVEVRPGRPPVEGAARSVLVHAATDIVAAVVSEPETPRVRIRGDVRAVGGEAVPGAAMRLLRGDETLAAARSDVGGTFIFDVDAERAGLLGSVVRVRFDPAEPWFSSSESAPLVLGEAPSAPLRWGWLAAPWAAVGIAFAAWQAVRRRRAPAGEAPAAEPRVDEVVRVGETVGGAVEVVVEAFDRSTGRAVRGAECWSAESPVPRAASTPWSAGRDGTLKLRVRAPGYESRGVEVRLRGGGRHVARVGMLGWREALFDRARPRIARAAGGSGAMPTPREAAADAPWVGLVEAGAYGPEAPGEQAVSAVESALAPSPPRAPSGVDAAN